MKGPKLYMLVTKDEYELPIAVFDTAGELAAFVGCSKNSIFSAYCHAKAEGTRCRYQIVEVEE